MAENKNMHLTYGIIIGVLVIFLFAVILIKKPTITGHAVADADKQGEVGAEIAKDDVEKEDGFIEKIKDSIDKKITNKKRDAEIKDLVTKLLELRVASNKKDTLATAELVSEINQIVINSELKLLMNPWQNIVNCVQDGCDDNLFFNMIDIVVSNNLDNINNEAIHSLIESYNYWNGKNIVLFSDSVTKTNKLIEENFNGDIKLRWNSIVECNGKCENFNELVIDLIEKLNNANS